MKQTDVMVSAGAMLLPASFLMFPGLGDAFRALSINHGYLLSFFKFAVLATFGECIALRITQGVYWKPGFGIIPRMLVWGVLGVVIKAAFIIFATGVPGVLMSLGLPVTGTTLASGTFAQRLILAFAISTAMNCIFAPVFMTLHKITDAHIDTTGGTVSGFLTPLPFGKIICGLDWNIMWNFVFKKTIPLFWIPAHTITFLLPSELRTLFAALLGIALGVILSYAKRS